MSCRGKSPDSLNLGRAFFSSSAIRCTVFRTGRASKNLKKERKKERNGNATPLRLRVVNSWDAPSLVRRAPPLSAGEQRRGRSIDRRRRRRRQMRLAGSRVSGNKARKMYALNKVPADRFPELVVSHGGHQVLAAGL